MSGYRMKAIGVGRRKAAGINRLFRNKAHRGLMGGAAKRLATGTDPTMVAAVLRHGSPGFPRRHADPKDCLRRLGSAAPLCFPARPTLHSLD